nr:CotD family spore coat protein [uncultured Bacillus sp.]
MYCRPKCCPTTVCPAVVHPTKCCVNHTCQNVIIPHVHPLHTTTVNHINYQNQHHFPQSASVVNEVTNTDIGAVPGLPPAPTAGFGAGFAPGATPGFGSGFGMGFGPGVRPRPGFFR